MQAAVTPPSSASEVSWDRMDKTRFYGWSATLFLGVRLSTYPFSLVKTRLQVNPPPPIVGASSALIATNVKASTSQIPPGGGGTWKMIGAILRREGIRGLYSGFVVAAIGAIPSQLLYLSIFEASKQFYLTHLPPLLHPAPISSSVPLESSSSLNENDLSTSRSSAIVAFTAGALSGLNASLVAQTLVVPIDIVKQRLQTQHLIPTDLPPSHSLPKLLSTPSRPKLAYQSGWAIGATILKSQGIRGLYRGYFMSLFTYSPTSAVWWGSFGAIKHQLQLLFARPLVHQTLPSDLIFTTFIQSTLIPALAGTCAGSIAAIVTNPLDVLKTRYQNGADKSLAFTARTLIQAEGYYGLGRGMMARILYMGPVSLMMTLTYELVKKWSTISEV